MADPQHVTLVANTVRTITLAVDANKVNICNVDGAAAVYATVDGSRCRRLEGTAPGCSRRRSATSS